MNRFKGMRCVAIVFAVLLGIALWQSRSRKFSAAGWKQSGSPPVGASQSDDESKLPGQGSEATAEAVPRGSVTSAPPAKSRAQQIREGLATLNDMPIVFYGRLEDQFGKPVVGATVTGNTIIYSALRRGSEHVSTQSDENGLFTIKAGKGESLGVGAAKPGYVLATRRTEFKFSVMYRDHFTPDPDRPVVMKMWKLQGAEPLVRLDWKWKLPHTNGPIRLDLLTGEVVPAGGDLQITVNRPDGEVSERFKQDWSVQIAAVNGGVIDAEEQEPIAFAVPTDGYSPSLIRSFSTNAPFTWSFGFKQALFTRLRDGRVYGMVDVSFRLNLDPEEKMVISMAGAANTNASRSFEGALERN